MSTRKHIIILTILITIGIGSLIVSVLIPGGKIRKAQAPEEHKQEYVQAPSTPSPDSLPVVSDAQEKEDAKAKPKRTAVSVSTSISIPEQYDDDGQYDESQYDDGQSEGDEEEVVHDENMYIDENGNVTDWEKWTLARMHKNGWYKPEDVPIIDEDPGGVSDGVYIWTEYEPAGPLSSQEPPEYVKARARELKEEQDRAAERKDAKEVISISRELGELYRPYKGPSWGLNMHRGNIPKSWYPYFDAIYKIELQAAEEEFRMRLSDR